MADTVITERNLLLDKKQTQDYLKLLNTFEEVAYDAITPQDFEQALDQVALMEDFIHEAATEQNVSAAWDSPLMLRFHETLLKQGQDVTTDRNQLIDDMLNQLIARRVSIVSGAENYDDLKAKMQKAGTSFVSTGKALIKPDHTKALQTGSGKGAEINVWEPRFSMVTEAIIGTKFQKNGTEHEIGFDDLCILEGEVSDKTMRNQPFRVIQIPKINREIAVCDLYGQSLIVNEGMHQATYYEKFSRPELRALGASQVTMSASWENRLIKKIANDWPDQTFSVDMVAHKKFVARKQLDLSPEIIGLAMLQSGAVDENHKIPNVRTKTPIPGHNGERWDNWNILGRTGWRGLPEGLTLSAVKILYGWDDEEKWLSDIRAIQEDEAFMPDQVMRVEEAIDENRKNQETYDLSPEIIGLAILKSGAVDKDQKIPNVRTKAPIPGHDGERWKNWNNMGHRGKRGLPEGLTLSAVKILYGWDDEEKWLSDIRAIQENEAFVPDQMMRVEEAIEQNKEGRPISSEIIALAMLQSGAVDENYKIPNAATKTPIPGHDGERWNSWNGLGHRGKRNLPEGLTLSKMKVICGWQEEGQKFSNGEYKEQWLADIAYYNKHGAMSDDLKQRIKIGVAEHVNALKAGNGEANEPKPATFDF